MKILLLGGTGAMGVPLSKILSKQGHEVFVTSRSKRTSADNITFIQANAKELELLKNILSKDKYDAIVDFLVYNTKELEERVELFLDSTSQYVFISSCRVFDITTEKITEKTPRILDVTKDEEFLKTDDYSLTKARQEDLLFNNEKKNWTIIRPSLTYNNRHFPLGPLEKEQWLYRSLHGRSIVFSEDMKNVEAALAYGNDVAKSIASLLGNEKALGEDFNIASEQSVSWGGYLSIYLTILKEKGFTPNVVYGQTCVKLKANEKDSQILYARGVNRHFDCSKLKDAGAYEMREPYEGFKEALTDFLNRPSFYAIDWMLEAWSDKESGEFTSLCEIPTFKSKIKYLIFRFGLEKLLYALKRR